MYVIDPAAPLVNGQSAVVWGVPSPSEIPPGREPERIATVGVYRPDPFDALQGLVRLEHWRGPRKRAEQMAYPCPPNIAVRVVGVLAKSRSRLGICAEVREQVEGDGHSKS
jgi:hypothetical protein